MVSLKTLYLNFSYEKAAFYIFFLKPAFAKATKFPLSFGCQPAHPTLSKNLSFKSLKNAAADQYFDFQIVRLHLVVMRA